MCVCVCVCVCLLNTIAGAGYDTKSIFKHILKG